MDRADSANTAEGAETSGGAVTEKSPPEPFVPRQVSPERVVPAGRAPEQPFREGELGQDAPPAAPRAPAGPAPAGPAGPAAPGKDEVTGTGTRIPRQRRAPSGPQRGRWIRSKRSIGVRLPVGRGSEPRGRFATEYALARRASGPRRRAGTIASGFALAVLSAAGVLAYLALNDDSIRPSQLPGSVDGLEAVGEQGTTQWERSAGEEVGSTVISRNYGSAGTGRTLRLVAARADLTGLLELGWAGDQGTAVGEGRCTQLLDITGQGEPETKPTMMLCWRTSEALSVYGIAIDQDRKPSGTETMAAVQDLWAELSS